MTDTLPPPSPPTLDPIATDMPCLSCGYNLRGLSPDARCPECGATVSTSLAAEPERTFTNEQRASLILASALLTASVTMTSGTLPVAFLLSLASGFGEQDAIPFLIAIWILIEHTLWGIATFSLDLPDHPLQAGNRWPRRHVWNKLFGIADPCCLLVVYLCMLVADTGYRDISAALGSLAAAGVFIARGGSVLLTGLWLIHIARPLRARPLRSQAILLMTAFLVINGTWALCSLWLAVQTCTRTYSETPVALAAFTAIPTLLLFAPWSAIVLAIFTRRFRKLPSAVKATPA